MPLLGSRGGGSVRGFGRFGKVALRSFIENFNRSLVSLLNQSTSDGQGIWSIVTGSWGANGSSGTASSNGVALVEMASPDISSATLDMSNGNGGIGIAFWGTSANSVYAVYPRYDSYDSTENGCYDQGYISSSCTSPQCNGSGCNYVLFYECDCGCSFANGNDSQCAGCCGFSGGLYNALYRNYAVTTQTITRYRSYLSVGFWNGSSMSNLYDYNWFLSQSSSHNPAYSIMVSTSGNTINIRAYTGIGLGGSQILNQNYSPSSPTRGVYAGIIRTSSQRRQNSSIDNLSITLS